MATRKDLPSILRLLTELAESLGKADEMKASISELERYGFGAQPLFEAVVAFDGAVAVGLAVFFSEYSTWRGTPGVYIQDLYVTREYRGDGLGRELISAVRQRARSWGSSYVKLTVYDGNEQALDFYRRLGFELRADELPLVWRD
jgi:GNAT superfamily N-acetyltransferase